MTYYVTYAALLCAAWAGRSARDLNWIGYWIVLIGLFLFSGFRFDVGCDWGSYASHFNVGAFLDPVSALARRDPGHWYLVSVLNEFGFSYLSLNIVTSAIFFVGVHFLARRQPDPLAFLVLCFPILIINMPMSTIRQGAAIGFMCLAFAAFIDRRILFYAGWIVLGSAFHSSILVFLMLTPFVRGRFNSRTIALGLLLAVPGAFALLQTEVASVAESRYIDTGRDSAGAAFRLGILSLSGLFFLYVLAPAWRRKFAYDFKLAAIGAWMMVGFFGLFFVSSVIGDRFGYYLIPIQAMIFARIPYLQLGRRRQIYAIAPYAALTFMFLVWTQISWHFNQCYIPYQFGFG